MKTKHTPGPWRIDDEADGFAHVASDTYHQILAGDGFLGEEGSGFFIHAIMKNADANLIAAAPELLEALELMIETYPYSPPCHGWQEQVQAHKAARAAIRKALGEEA